MVAGPDDFQRGMRASGNCHYISLHYSIKKLLIVHAYFDAGCGPETRQPLGVT